METARRILNSHYKGKEPSRIVFEVTATLVGLFGLFKVVNNAQEYKENVLKLVFKSLKQIPMVQGEVEKEKDKLKQMLVKTLGLGYELHKKIPEKGVSHGELLDLMKKMVEKEKPEWESGKISGAIYNNDKELNQLLCQVYALYSISNALHPSVFPSVRKFEAEVVRMACTMMQGDENTCGALTSGGTESILMAVKAHRDYYNKKNPEMIVPVSAHAAFDKAASYFKIKIVHVPVDKDYKADVNAIRKLINKNTILIVGSAPGFPHGIIDPLVELGALAEEFGIGLHSDCCLGGFLLPWVRASGRSEVPPFDFSIRGVTSISADTHKYGYATKGTSVVMFRNKDLRRSMFFCAPDWPGGMYASPTIAGSRPGALIACCWAALVSTGQETYKKKAMGIWNTAQEIKQGIRKMNSLKLVGDSYSSVVAFAPVSNDLNIFKVADAMTSKGWHLNNLQRPSCVHICVTNYHVGKADLFLKDLEDSVSIVMKDPKAFPNGSAGVYGMAASFPDRATVADLGLAYIDGCLDVF